MTQSFHLTKDCRFRRKENNGNFNQRSKKRKTTADQKGKPLSKSHQLGNVQTYNGKSDFATAKPGKI